MPKDTKASALLKRRMFWSLCFIQIVFEQLDLREWGTSGEGTQVHVWREQNAAPEEGERGRHGAASVGIGWGEDLAGAS